MLMVPSGTTEKKFECFAVLLADPRPTELCYLYEIVV